MRDNTDQLEREKKNPHKLTNPTNSSSEIGGGGGEAYEVTETVDCSSSSMAYIPWKSHEGERKAIVVQKPLFC
jgi:hypothetical protein